MAIKPKPRERSPVRRTARVKETRGSAASRGYDHRWRKARLQWLAINPACNACGWIDKSREMVVDHIVPHRGDVMLFWDCRNWQTLCRKCHTAKTARGE